MANDEKTMAAPDGDEPKAAHIVTSPHHPESEAFQDPSGRNVSGYDFRRPQHLSAEQIRQIQAVHHHAATTLKARFARFLNVTTEVSVEQAEELTYGLLSAAMEPNTYAAVLDLDPLEDRGMIMIDAGLALACVDRVLGGDGKNLPAPRALTSVDEVAMESALNVVLGSLRDAWQAVCPMKMDLAERHADARQVQLLADSEAILLINLAFSGDLGEGRARLCLPIASLKSAMDGASERTLGLNVDPRKIPVLRAAIIQSLGNATLSATARVGKADVPIRQMLGLGVGDVLRLDQPAANPIRLNIAGRPTFHVKMGLQGRNKAVQVLESLRKE